MRKGFHLEEHGPETSAPRNQLQKSHSHLTGQPASHVCRYRGKTLLDGSRVNAQTDQPREPAFVNRRPALSSSKLLHDQSWSAEDDHCPECFETSHAAGGVCRRSIIA